MRTERALQGIAALAGTILVLTLISLAVRALSVWWAILILLGGVVLAFGGAALARRRVRRGTVIEIDLDGGLIETKGSDPITRMRARSAVTVRDFVDSLARGARDPRVSGLVVRLGNGGMELGHAQELRDAVHRFRESGKKTVAFSEAFGESGSATVDYYLASAFEEIHLQPMGQVSVQGLVARSPFLRGVLDNLRVVADFDHRKEYKAAKYVFTETGFTEPHREALEAVAGDQFSQMVQGISADRGLDRADVESLIDTAPLTAEEALAAGLVDHIGFREEAYEAAGERSKFLFHDRYLKKAGRPHRKGQRIALVYGTGSIARGNPRFDPLTGGSSLGADEVAQALREAIDDDKVEAIVFRVDSPGGSAVASEVVGHEVARARSEGKPVVVSMGNVAGSGGYWISAGADKIVAQPGTITGSIGVVAGKLANREAWRRLGITFDQIPFGQNATYGVTQDVLSDTERERRTAIIDDIYDQFVQRVATGRNLQAAQVEEIARGRIWTGAQARDNGLVDVLGGLNTAIDLAKEAAGVTVDEDVRLTVLPRKRTLPTPEGKEGSDPIHQLGAALFEVMSGLGATASAVQARMPWVTIR
jgi:protease IV